MADYTVTEEDPELMKAYASNLQILRMQYYSEFGAAPKAQQQEGGQDEG